jgi:hypothetical protein
MEEDVFARRLITGARIVCQSLWAEKGSESRADRAEDVSKLCSLFRRSSGHRVSLARSEIELFARGEIIE